MRFAALLAAALIAAAPATAARAQTHQGGAWTTAAHLHRGVNILSSDPIWANRAKARFKAKHFRVIRQGGFDFVRVVLSSFPHMDAQNRLDSNWLATLDWVLKNATDAGLNVIVDEHDFNRCSEDPDACQPKLISFWEQIGRRYAGAPKSVLFELMNEPHGKLDAARWNAMLRAVIPVVRATNPTRTLVIGPTRWNSLDVLPNLELPKDDRNILVTFHSYDPFQFTHQGAPWVKEMKTVHDVPFTDADAAMIRGEYDRVAAWSAANDRPVLLGEFGAYERSGTPIEARARYTATVRAQAEAHGFPWAYWQFDGDFIVYDINRDQWIEPIRAALAPTKR